MRSSMHGGGSVDKAQSWTGLIAAEIWPHAVQYAQISLASDLQLPGLGGIVGIILDPDQSHKAQQTVCKTN